MKLRLDPEEKEIAAAFDRGEWKPAADVELSKARYAELARATFRKDRRVNLRISAKDLQAIQTRALEEGMPYQTLIASLLHKYACGRLREL